MADIKFIHEVTGRPCYLEGLDGKIVERAPQPKSEKKIPSISDWIDQKRHRRAVPRADFPNYIRSTDGAEMVMLRPGFFYNKSVKI